MYHTISIRETEKKLNTNISRGLSSKEVLSRRKIYGLNKLQEKKKTNIFVKFLAQFKDFMIIILLIAAIISACLSYIQHTNEYMDSIIIVAIVVFNAIMGLIQEEKAEKSLEALKNLSSPTTKVRRNSKVMVIPSEEVVVGDIIILEAGNLVSADARLITSYNLKIEESSLTGETLPIDKDASLILKKDISIGDCINMVFATTVITAGHGEAIVVATGMNTSVGKIASMIITNETSQTPLQKKLGDVGKKLGTLCLIICLVIFVIGIFKSIPFFDMFMTSVGLAVAAIPEGLPAIVTIMLSIGVTHMAKKNAIIRKLPAVETLGSSSVICSDKTGTLTQNKMEVVKLCDVEGRVTNNETLKLMLTLGSLCNDSTINYDKNQILVDGEATEVAIVNCAIKNKIFKDKLDKTFKRENEIPFESSRKLMSTIHKYDNKLRVVVKGAPDNLINRCTRYYKDGYTYNLDTQTKNKLLSLNEDMANNALRVLAISYKDIDSMPIINSDNVENNLVFVGLIGMIDPPREGVKEAVLKCKRAGIKTVMITGDHILTAKAIAKDLNILQENELAVTGSELDKISDKDLKRNIFNYSVFARVSPEHKVRIVNAFKSTGSIVAMTGDGVNDAPALKKADIGIAMGKNGTDVAKNASDMVLTDDNFVTIVGAVEEGRHIYDNIKKAVHFLLATNIGEIVVIFLGLLLGFDTPLYAIHLLWINLVTDSLPALGLGMENKEKDIMLKKPKNPKKSIFSDGLYSKIFFEGLMIGILTLFAFAFGSYLYNVETGRTMAFICLSTLELVHSFNIRSDKESVFEIGIFKNKYLNLAFIAGIILQISVVTIKPIASIFKVVNLSFTAWCITIIISLMPLIIIEFRKKVHEILFGKRVYSISGYKKTV